ncbi:MAG: hypothetical protein KJ556_02575 [Gammaproteobacteria bacterium]|nr:hypothetical protein [Gammaproteobacteria bacterium]MBU2056651.1 hypothetical protein [Gammaproteobacteria bacterium]MBU2173988.1 hypothetical protein [Gammaproteobacteria bacterium]MBU2247294.1 hypothetical protein [Gammaproteobacteria bacterium]MBU2343946.1 hypothetical protein [Gammaproteobacteria bacterium]
MIFRLSDVFQKEKARKYGFEGLGNSSSKKMERQLAILKAAEVAHSTSVETAKVLSRLQTRPIFWL